MTGTGANNAPAVLETPGGRSHLQQRCNVPDRIDAPDAESTDHPHASALPDDPNLEMELAGGRFDPGQDWLDVMCVGCHAAILVSPGGEPVCPQCRA